MATCRESLPRTPQKPAAAFALAVMLSVQTAGVDAQPGATPQSVVPFRSCALRGRLLTADIQPGRLPDVLSVVFNVKDKFGRDLLTEILPVLGNPQLLRIVDQPLDINRTMHNAAEFSCRASNGLGSELSKSSACMAPVPVDMGVALSLRAVEVARNNVAALVTAKIEMLGALYLQNFRGEMVYLRGEPSGRTSTATLRGPNPATIVITLRIAQNDRVLELGVNEGTPLDTICL